MKCTVCKSSQMARCGECGNMVCKKCAKDAKGHYPKMTGSKCPFCGKAGKLQKL